MGCTVCGSNVPCQSCPGCCNVQDPIFRCNTGQSSGCCQNVVAPVPTPFYNCAPACPESHTQRVIVQTFSADVKLIDTWNIPACGQSAVVNTESLKAIVPGSYLWNPTYGYFEVSAFNSGTGQVTLINHCNTGNASAGTNVPACTEFTVTVPPCDCGTGSQVCVAIDFTAPDDNTCIDITLTSTTGLTASDTIQIGTGFYFLEAIKPNDVVTICNHGQGITPGTSVIARDVNGNYQYCISIISTNPCDRTAEDSVRLLGCGTDAVTVPLECTTPGWVPTRISGDLDDVACRPTGILECTTLTQQLNFTSGNATYNNIAVSDTSEFANGDVVEFAGGAFTATITVVDGTHLNFVLSPVPSFNGHYVTGTLFCLQSCCDTINTRITNLEAMLIGNSNSTGLTETNITVNNGSPTHDTAHLTWSVVNPSSAVMRVMTILEFFVTGQFENGTASVVQQYPIDVTLHYKINGGSTQSQVMHLTGILTDTPDIFAASLENIFHRTDIVPGNSTYTYELWGTVDWTGGVDGDFLAEVLTVSQSFLGTAL